MRSIKIKTIILFLLIFLIILSGYLTYAHTSEADVRVCIIGSQKTSSCSDVQNTSYGSFLGIKVYHWGLTAFTILLIVHLTANTNNKFKTKAKRLFLFLSAIGALIGIYFLFIQFFILKTICSTCTIIDVTTILILFLALEEVHRKKRR